MGSFSDFLENELLDHILGNSAYTPPATVYIALCTAAPTDASTGSTITEATYTGYARASVVNNATNFPAASGGSKSNGTQITFADCTGGSSVITHIAVCDALTAGNVLAWGSLSETKTVTNGDQLIFEISKLTITLD